MRELLVNRSVNPLLETLPEWVKDFRPHQRQAIHEVLDAYTRVPVVVLDAPTGSGKTLIAEAARRMLRTRGLYVCSTKSLQGQFARDFPYAQVLKGRSNYPTELFPEQYHPEDKFGNVSAEDCTWQKSTGLCQWCSFKSKCPYECAKAAALRSELAVLNTSYFLTEANHIGRFSEADFVIADEADTLEAHLMGYVSVEVSQGRMRKYGWKPPEKVTVPASWRDWIEGVLPEVWDRRNRIKLDHTDVKGIKEFKYLSNLHEKLGQVLKGLEDGFWVYTGRDDNVSFRPSRVDSIGKDNLWRHGKKWLLMSATVISADEMLDSLGYRDNYEVVTVASTFPKENRKINVVDVANMSRKGEADAKERMIDAIHAVLRRHSGERVLIHTVSYDLAAAICAGLETSGRRVLSYASSSTRDGALSEYVSERGLGSVLVAPSMDRGIDLPGDLCRVVIVAKVPYPYLGDRQVSARLHSRGGQVWYTVSTIRTLVQMFGRAMRSETDSFTGYALDSQFRNGLWSRGRGLFPTWFSEAIDWRASL